jgi:hypothetical protein
MLYDILKLYQVGLRRRGFKTSCCHEYPDPEGLFSGISGKVPFHESTGGMNASVIHKQYVTVKAIEIKTPDVYIYKEALKDTIPVQANEVGLRPGFDYARTATLTYSKSGTDYFARLAPRAQWDVLKMNVGSKAQIDSAKINPLTKMFGSYLYRKTSSTAHRRIFEENSKSYTFFCGRHYCPAFCTAVILE